MKSGIYALKCVPTAQYYIGTAVDWEKRIASHLVKLKAGRHRNKKLQGAWIKYGPTAFEFKLVELCSIDKLLERERCWVEATDAIDNGFNPTQLGSNGGLTHGLTYSRTFKSWESMLQRCTNTNSPDYPHYGGRGIKVCARWQKSFLNFMYDMDTRPEGTSLDRYPDKNGDYKPSNCRWATASQQQKNKCNTLFITYEGVTKPLVEWADEKGMPRDLLRRRYHAGMQGDELFAPSYSRYEGEPTGIKRKRTETRYDLLKYEYQGEMRTITELAELTGIKRDTLWQRLRKYGMPVEKALQKSSLKFGERRQWSN